MLTFVDWQACDTHAFRSINGSVLFPYWSIADIWISWNIGSVNFGLDTYSCVPRTNGHSSPTWNDWSFEREIPQLKPSDNEKLSECTIQHWTRHGNLHWPSLWCYDVWENEFQIDWRCLGSDNFHLQYRLLLLCKGILCILLDFRKWRGRKTNWHSFGKAY